MKTTAAIKTRTRPPVSVILLLPLQVAVAALSATVLPAAELYRQDFEGEGDPAGNIAQHFFATEQAGNRWSFSPRSGTGGGGSLSAAPGQPVSAVSKASIPGFSTHPVITVTLDTVLSARWNGDVSLVLPFAVKLIADPKNPDSTVAGFHIDYEPGTSGGDTQFNVGADREGSFIWFPASALEEYEPDARSSSVAAWFRWTAVFTHDTAAGTLKTALSVAAIGKDGTGQAKPIQKWQFDPVRLKGPLPPALHFAVTGRARDGFGIFHIDNVRIGTASPAP